MIKEKIYIIAEIGINHNGDLSIAKKLIDIAKVAGCDVVKFQKRNPDVCVPEHQKTIMRDTPWGRMTYLEYKNKIIVADASNINVVNRVLEENEEGQISVRGNIKIGILNGSLQFDINGQNIKFNYQDEVILGYFNTSTKDKQLILKYYK